MPVTLPRKASLMVCSFALLCAVVIALIPVEARFGNDPLLRLRELDPQLSPPPAKADCGSPVTNLGALHSGTGLFEVARANACEHAVRRRMAVAVAVGWLLAVAGLLLLAGARESMDSLSRLPDRNRRTALRSGRGDFGQRPDSSAERRG